MKILSNTKIFLILVTLLAGAVIGISGQVRPVNDRGIMGLQQLFCTNNTQRFEQLGPDDILAAIAAC